MKLSVEHITAPGNHKVLPGAGNGLKWLPGAGYTLDLFNFYTTFSNFEIIFLRIGTYNFIFVSWKVVYIIHSISSIFFRI